MEIFEPFMLNGFVSLSGDNCPPTSIKILRDTGASQSLILADITAGNHVTQQQQQWRTFEEISPLQVRKSSIILLICDWLEFGLKQRRRKDVRDLPDVLDLLNNT